MPDPRADRPHIPKYGIPTTRRGLLPWRDVERALVGAPRYWIATTDADGRPHVIQQWGAWVEGCLYFEGGMTPRYARNLARDGRVAVAVERGELAIMVEGRAAPLADPTESLAAAIVAAYRRKRYGYVPRPEGWKKGGLWRMRPERAFAWSFRSYVKSATRFRF